MNQQTTKAKLRAQLYKTNNVVNWPGMNISNTLYTKMPPFFFSANNMSYLDFMHTVRFNESLIMISDINPTALRKAKIV